jgi:hypothetical protein
MRFPRRKVGLGHGHFDSGKFGPLTMHVRLENPAHEIAFEAVEMRG